MKKLGMFMIMGALAWSLQACNNSNQNEEGATGTGDSLYNEGNDGGMMSDTAGMGTGGTGTGTTGSGGTGGTGGADGTGGTGSGATGATGTTGTGTGANGGMSTDTTGTNRPNTTP